jgi:nicotinamidase-related amidase
MDFQFVPGKTVEVPEIPYEDEVGLPLDDTAVIVVDMQNDFVHENGSLVVPAARETVPNIQRLLAAAREVDVPVVYTQDTTFPDDLEFDIWPEHCLQGTWGWEIVKELEPQPEDLIVPKSRYDAFYESWLDHFLTRIWQVHSLVIVGTVSNICVAHTCASAGLRWFEIVVPANGISALNTFDQALTLRQVSGLYAGTVVRSTDDIKFGFG